MRRLSVCFGISSSRAAPLKLFARATAANSRMSSSRMFIVSYSGHYVNSRGIVSVARSQYHHRMATDVRVELPIARTRADVAAYMFDPTNDAAWTSGVIAVNPLTPGRLHVGS